MQLGAFSISLNVTNIHTSFDFYTKLGFIKIGGDINQKWLILKNEQAIIGLFQDMIQKNTLTFNPGWNQEGTSFDPFMDVREISSKLIEIGILDSNRIDSKSGPAYIVIEDPDGNPILIDQHR